MQEFTPASTAQVASVLWSQERPRTESCSRDCLHNAGSPGIQSTSLGGLFSVQTDRRTASSDSAHQTTDSRYPGSKSHNGPALRWAVPLFQVVLILVSWDAVESRAIESVSRRSTRLAERVAIQLIFMRFLLLGVAV